MKCPIILQHEEMDCGSACLAMVSKYYGLDMPLVKFRELLNSDMNGTSVYDIVTASKVLKLNATPLKGEFVELIDAIRTRQVLLPCIALVRKENFLHYVVIYKVTKKRIIFVDPGEGLCKWCLKDFEDIYMNAVIMIDKTAEFQKDKYSRKTKILLGHLIKNNYKILFFIFVFSAFATLLSILGNIALEYTINIGIENDIECEDENCTEHSVGHMSSNEDVTVEKFHAILDILIESFEIILLVGIIVYVLKLVIDFMRSYFIALWTSKCEYELIHSYFSKMIKMPLKVFTDRKTGDFLARYTDIRQVSGFVIEVTTTFLLNLIYCIGFGLVLFILNIKMLCVNILIMIMFAIVVVGCQRIIKKANHKMLQANTVVVSHLEESIKGISVIKTFGIGKDRISVFKSFLEKYTSARKKLVSQCYIQNNVINFLVSIGNFVVVYVGIKLCISGNISISTLIMYYIMSNYFMSAFGQLMCLQPKFSEAIVICERIEDVYESVSENLEGEKIEKITSIQLENVSYKYNNIDWILKDVSLDIKEGEKVLLLGKNGCGKSTLANIMAGNYIPTSGKVKYNYKKDINIESIKNCITYIEQETFLFHDTIYNNIVLGCREVSIDKVQEVCKLTKVDEFVQLLPSGYNTILCDGGDNLSGGQKQKIALARALLRDSMIYILDETTSNLDKQSEREICDVLHDNFREKTLVIISHNDIWKQMCDKQYVLGDGKIELI